jgi:hypothetical protein
VRLAGHACVVEGDTPQRGKTGHHLSDAVTAQFLRQGVGHDDRDNGFEHHDRARHGTDVRTFVIGEARFAGGKVNRVLAFTRGGDGFHGGAQPNGLAVGDAAFDAAAGVAPAFQPCGAGHNGVVSLRAGLGGAGEGVADLDPFHRRHAQHRLRESGVQTPVPVDMRAESGGYALHDDFDDAAERLALVFGLLDRRDDLRGGLRVGALHF